MMLRMPTSTYRSSLETWPISNPIRGDAIMPPAKLNAAWRAELPGPLCSVTPTAKPNNDQRHPDPKDIQYGLFCFIEPSPALELTAAPSWEPSRLGASIPPCHRAGVSARLDVEHELCAAARDRIERNGRHRVDALRKILSTPRLHQATSRHEIHVHAGDLSCVRGELA